MGVGCVSALSALGGSMVGGLTTGLTSWMNPRSQVTAGQILREPAAGLYKDIIPAASKSYAEALVVSEPKIKELIELFAMITRMLVISSSDIADNCKG